jgi:hypothetical protein
VHAESIASGLEIGNLLFGTSGRDWGTHALDAHDFLDLAIAFN